MRRDLLDRLAAEAGTRATGSVVRGVLCRPGHGLALELDGAERARLDLAPGPPEPRLALTGRWLEAATDGPAEVLRPRLIGRVLTGVEARSEDRIVRFTLDDGAALILEVLGPLSNLYYVGADGRVAVRARACVRPGGTELRVGDPWVPLAAEGGWRALPWEPAPAPGLALPWNPEGADPLRSLRPSMAQLRTDGPGPEDTWFEAHAALGDAATRRHELLARHAEAESRRRRLGTRLRSARQRLDRLRQALDADERQAAGHEEMRRQATAILAGLARAESTPTGWRVPDPWQSEGDWIEVAAPAGRTPARVAGDLFRAAGRLERGLARVRARAAAVRDNRDRVAGLEEALSEVADAEALAALERQADAVLPSPKPIGRDAVPATSRARPRSRLESDPRSRRIRRLEAAPGWPVLIGGSAADNDWLTFRLARGHDFWLHAADYPGAHVVVRNPARRSDPPPDVLRRAAAWALHFSKAPRAERGDVRWTQVRHLRRGRGAPPGTVFLARFTTLSATPAPPPSQDPFGPP